MERTTHMAKYKAFILDDVFTSYQREMAVLAQADAEAIVVKEWVPDDQLIAICRDADALMLNRPFSISRQLVEGLPKLKVISLYGIGTDGVDFASANER